MREVLLAHPQVSDAAVRLMTSEASSRLEAFVVPAAGSDIVALKSELLRWTETRLTVPGRPKKFSVGDQLPRNALDKLTNWPLSASRRTGAHCSSRLASQSVAAAASSGLA